jgi:hypothetical protein
MRISMLLACGLSATAAAADVDVSAGPPRASARMLGMGRAYRAISSGALSADMNPAALAVIPDHARDWDRWRFDGLFAVGQLVPFVRNVDLPALTDAPVPAIAVVGGVIAQRDQHAGALIVDLRTDVDDATGRGVALVELNGGWGVSLQEDQLQIGVTPGVLIVRAAPEARRSVTALPTLGAGARWDVPDSPFRVGATFHAPWRQAVTGSDVDGLHRPWEAGLGFAVRRGRIVRGPRSLRAGSAEVEEMFVQAAFDVALVGAIRDAVTVQDWTDGDVEGEDLPLAASFAFGVEMAPLPEHLRLRAGTYTEPGRVTGAGLLVHGTVGVDVAVVEWPKDRLRWRVGPVLDVSAAEVQVGMGLGQW